MKRMRYLAGAAGLAPAALGIAVPAAASAAAAPAAPASAKTVSLHHVLAATAQAGAAAVSSSSSQAGSPASPAAACTGDTYFRIPQSGTNLKGHGWYRNSNLDFYTCVGTVDVWVHFTKNICKNATLSIGTATKPHQWVRTHSVCGSAGHSRMTQFNVHSWFRHEAATEKIDVCANSTYNHNGPCWAGGD